MLPITRANLQSFCRNCLREFTATEPTHDIELSSTHSNRLFPQKVCHCCFIKIKTLKGFQDRANLATGILRLVVEERCSQDKESKELESRLKLFCRLCLKLNTKPIVNYTESDIFMDIKECTGLQIEINPMKLAQNDHPLADDARYTHSICMKCQTTLKGYVEYRKVAKQTTDYLQSILDDDDEDEGEVVKGTGNIVADAGSLVTGKISPVEIANQSAEVESVLLPDSSLDSKFVVNVIENDLNDLYSEEDAFSSDGFVPELPNNKKNESVSRNQNKAKTVKNEHGNDSLPRKKANARKTQESQVENEIIEEPCSNNKQLEETNVFKIEEEELLLDITSQNFSNEFHGHPQICKDETLLQTKNTDEDFIKTEINDGTASQEDIFSALAQLNKLEAMDVVKQQTDVDSDGNYEPEDVDFADSDTNSEDVCLAKLFSKDENKSKANDLKTTRKKTRRRLKIKAPAEKEAKAKYECDKCNRSFFKKHTIEAHLRMHEGASKAFACTQCESSFTTYQALQHHIGVHDENEGITVRGQRRRYKSSRECPHCHLVLKRHIDLANHIQRQHNGVLAFKCKICGKRLSTLAALNRHELNHSDERPFACQFCEKRYNYETELKVHMQRHIADPALLCPICKTARANLEELQRHIASHRKPHQCFKCGKVFTKAYSLHQHELSVHQNLRVHKCPDCNQSFKGRKTLTLHRLHHDPTGRPEKCRVCGLFFRTKRGRLRHTSKFHPDVELPPEEPPPAAVDDGRSECCEKCPLRFKTKRGLMLHTKKTHEKGQRIAKTEDELREKYGDRSEICQLCQLQCFSKKGLSRHIRKKHPDFAQAKDQQKTANCSDACTLCPLKFKTARGLVHHMKRMHRDAVQPSQNSELLKNFTPPEDEMQKLSLPLHWLQ